MKCPICNIDLVMSERQGIEIDYCPQCRGVWLDRGELDKIIDRSSAHEQRQDYRADNDYRNSRDDRDRYDSYEPDRQNHRKKRKKESFLSDLFEFGD